MTVIKPPGPQLLRTCDVLEELVGSLAGVIAARRRPDFGKWEAIIEADLLLRLLIRHTEGVIAMARLDLVLLPAALVLARAAFETGLRARWLLFPDREFDREARWLVHLEEEERLWGRLADVADRTGPSVETYRVVERDIKGFRLAVCDRLPPGTSIPSGIPNVATALKEQGDERRYISYALLSQFVHGGHYAAGTWRTGLGTFKQFNEHTPPSEWAMTLRITWWSLFRSAERFATVACAPGTELAEVRQLSLLELLFADLEVKGTEAAQQGAAPGAGHTERPRVSADR